MSELLQNIDLNGAELLFLRLNLIVLAIASGVLGIRAYATFWEHGEWRWGASTIVLWLLCWEAAALLFGGLP